MLMHKLGLKLWSTNKNYIDKAIRLYDKQVYSYIELFAVPTSYKSHIHLWKNLNIPFIIHAAHSLTGLNLAQKNQLKQNMKLAHEAQQFADTLNSKHIIFHPGINGTEEETVRQLNKINDSRILIENKPYYGIPQKNMPQIICNGSTLEHIDFIMKNTNVGFCLD